MSAYFDEGRYRCRITGQGFGESKNKRTPFFYVEFRPEAFIDKEGDANALVAQEYTRTVRLWLTEKAHDISTGILHRLGWKSDRFQDLDGDPPRVDLRDQVIELVCKHTAGGDGDQWEEWNFPPAGSSAQPSDGDIAKRLDLEYQKRFERGTQSPEQQAQQEETQTPVDLPF